MVGVAPTRRAKIYFVGVAVVFLANAHSARVGAFGLVGFVGFAAAPPNNPNNLNNHNADVAPAALSVGFRSSSSSSSRCYSGIRTTTTTMKMMGSSYGGNDDNNNGNGEAEDDDDDIKSRKGRSNNNNRVGDGHDPKNRRRGGGGDHPSSTSIEHRRDISSYRASNNTRAKMKKATSSTSRSRSKLLMPPPSIISQTSSSPSSSAARAQTSSRNGEERWMEEEETDHYDDDDDADAVRSRRRTTTKDASAQSPRRRTARPPSPPQSPAVKVKSRRREKRRSKLRIDHHNDDDDGGGGRGKLLPIPPFASGPDGGGATRSSATSDSSDPLRDYLPPVSSSSSSNGSPFDAIDSMLESTSSSSSSPYSDSAIEGVLPVSELFYQSTQSIRSSGMGGDPNNDININGNNEGMHDDEELPFSAEQTDRLSTLGNKIRVRKNRANDGGGGGGGDPSSTMLGDIVSGMMGDGLPPSDVVRRELTTMAEQEREEQRRLKRRRPRTADAAKGGGGTNGGNRAKQQQQQQQPRGGGSGGARRSSERIGGGTTTGTTTTTGRKMVRRGMEMLVGGEPINADPPQRSVELNYYRKHPRNWARAITTNSPDFGPLLHMHSAGKVGRESVGLFCENFVDVTRRWGVCPRDLEDVVVEHEARGKRGRGSVAAAAAAANNDAVSVSKEDMDSLIESIASPPPGTELTRTSSVAKGNLTDPDEAGPTVINSHELDAPKGFGGAPPKKWKKRKGGGRGGRSGMTSEKSLDAVQRREIVRSNQNLTSLAYTLGGELKFSLGVGRAELERGRAGALRRVLRDGIGTSIGADRMGFDVHVSRLVADDGGEGSTNVVVRFRLYPRRALGAGEAERAVKEVNGALASAMDDGKMAMTLAQRALEEKGWSARIRNRIVEEFLFETEDDDEDKDSDAGGAAGAEAEAPADFSKDETYDGPFGMDGDVIYAKDDIWLGGGNGGVFFDYSESNYMNSPHKGKLGPLLVHATMERARQNQPKVIAIGDVHGCIDELKALLRKCDYHPGDVIVFLGDLVCKGPDSLSVVQMARELGAIGIRGNHDFEVVRWHQAIKSGADPPVIGSEHYYVASSLSAADLRWMYSLPWFISSSHLNALFVHAGFVSGIRLAKQNPRLMMNMRSILPDGTVTSKFFNNWPWARLWDGPQTVLFGHDADRGLQQYEHAIGLDTGCVYGGKLTACILPERRIVSVNAKREYFQYRRKHFD